MFTAITGATGHLGRLVNADHIAVDHQADIAALARTSGRDADPVVALREADDARQDTLEPALDGVDKLLLILSDEIG